MKMKSTTQLGFLCFVMLSIGFSSLQGASLLTNGDFEDPVQPNFGNNFVGQSIPSWALTGATGTSINVARTGGFYQDGPDFAQTGEHFVDIADGAGYFSQTITLTTASTIEFGAYISRRDDVGGGFVSIYDSTNSILLFSSPVVFNDLTVSEEVWTLTSATTGDLAAGSYVFRLNLDDDANGDSAFATSTPIPEPAVGALSLLGFLALARRRRQGN